MSRGELLIAEWIERLPTPERNGLKGSIVMVSLLFGLIAAPEEILCLRPSVELVETQYRETPLIFPGSRGGGGSEKPCFLEVAAVQNGEYGNIQFTELEPEFCQMAPDWQYIPALEFGSHCSEPGVRCSTLTINLDNGTTHEFNFPTPAYFRITTASMEYIDFLPPLSHRPQQQP